jgi:hypothetical protein
MLMERSKIWDILSPQKYFPLTALRKFVDSVVPGLGIYLWVAEARLCQKRDGTNSYQA